MTEAKAGHAERDEAGAVPGCTCDLCVELRQSAALAKAFSNASAKPASEAQADKFSFGAIDWAAGVVCSNPQLPEVLSAARARGWSPVRLGITRGGYKCEFEKSAEHRRAQ